MSVWTELAVAVLMLIGASFALVGSIGLLRLRDVYSRLHGPTKATTMGVGSIILASLVFFSADMGTLSIHEVLITLFLFITAPVSAHLLAKTAMHREEKKLKATRGEPWQQ